MEDAFDMFWQDMENLNEKEENGKRESRVGNVSGLKIFARDILKADFSGNIKRE